jgi:hypothetical protein
VNYWAIGIVVSPHQTNRNRRQKRQEQLINATFQAQKRIIGSTPLSKGVLPKCKKRRLGKQGAETPLFLSNLTTAKPENDMTKKTQTPKTKPEDSRERQTSILETAHHMVGHHLVSQVPCASMSRKEVMLHPAYAGLVQAAVHIAISGQEAWCAAEADDDDSETIVARAENNPEEKMAMILQPEPNLEQKMSGLYDKDLTFVQKQLIWAEKHRRRLDKLQRAEAILADEVPF